MRDRFQWARLLAFVTGRVNQDLLMRFRTIFKDHFEPSLR
jgi:hypothetical protein